MKSFKFLVIGIVVLLIFGSTGLSFSSVAIEKNNDERPVLEGFEVEILDPEEDDEYPLGEEISIRYLVENTGEAEDTQDIELTVSDDEEEIVHEDNTGLTLQPNVTVEMLFRWTAEEPGDYKIEITCEDDSDDVDVKVVVEEKAYFGVEITSYEEEIIGDDDWVVEYIVENRGTEEELQDITLDIFDEEGRAVFSETERIRLDPDENYTGEFTWETDKNETGEFDVLLMSHDDRHEVTVTVLQGAYFEVDIYEYPDEVIEGEKFKVTYIITNTGEVDGEQDIKLILDGEVLTNESRISLGMGSVYGGEFTWKTGEEHIGEHDLKIASNNEEVEFTVDVLRDAFFEVEITAYNEEVKEEETVIVEYRITNRGDVEGEQIIEFFIDGEPGDSKVVTLEGDEVFEGEFSWTPDEAGEYSLTVLSEDEERVVTVHVEEEDGTPGFTLGILLLGVTAAVWIFQRKKS